MGTSTRYSGEDGDKEEEGESASGERRRLEDTYFLDSVGASKCLTENRKDCYQEFWEKKYKRRHTMFMNLVSTVVHE